MLYIVDNHINLDKKNGNGMTEKMSSLSMRIENNEVRGTMEKESKTSGKTPWLFSRLTGKDSRLAGRLTGKGKKKLKI